MVGTSGGGAVDFEGGRMRGALSPRLGPGWEGGFEIPDIAW